jgi:hypothetical protein
MYFKFVLLIFFLVSMPGCMHKPSMNAEGLLVTSEPSRLPVTMELNKYVSGYGKRITKMTPAQFAPNELTYFNQSLLENDSFKVWLVTVKNGDRTESKKVGGTYGPIPKTLHFNFTSNKNEQISPKNYPHQGNNDPSIETITNFTKIENKVIVQEGECTEVIVQEGYYKTIKTSGHWEHGLFTKKWIDGEPENIWVAPIIKKICSR